MSAPLEVAQDELQLLIGTERAQMEITASRPWNLFAYSLVQILTQGESCFNLQASFLVGLRRMAKTQRCTVPGCEKAAAASLDARLYCQEHFISACYKEIDRYTHLVRETGFRQIAAESMHHFLTECTRQATDLSQHAEDLDNLARARLLDILLSAAELSRHLRRSPRKVATLRIRLHCEKPGRAWEEETKTRVLSRHGALVECQHLTQSGDALLVLQPDSGKQAQARVVWCHHKEEGRREIGIEFLDCENFWDLDWNAVETAV